jgi:metal-responsive CopG/Arc/MetJ family transcriptional regulator
MFTKNSIRATAGYGGVRTVAISMPVSIVEEIEKRRRFDSRSRYILRAVDRYLREEEEVPNDNNNN